MDPIRIVLSVPLQFPELLAAELSHRTFHEQPIHAAGMATDREMLHFEIRRDGKPVDPLIYLPDRST